MANYAEAGKTSRTLTEREQKLLLKVTGEHRAGYRDHRAWTLDGHWTPAEVCRWTARLSRWLWSLERT